MTVTAPAAPTRPAASTPIPFGRLVRAEWRKATGTRAARWLLAAAAAAGAGAMAIPLLFPHNISQTRAGYLTWAGLGVTRLLPVVLILAMTAEWSQRTAMTTFTLEPRRGRVLMAKAVTGLGITLAGGCLALLCTQLALTGAHLAGRRADTGWDWSELAGVVVFVLLTGAVGIAFGSLLHNTATAVVTYFALGAAFNLFNIPALERAGQWVNTGQVYGWVLDGQWRGHGAQIATATLLWVVLPLALGTARTLRREAR